MKTIIVDAQKICDAKDPVSALASLYGFQAESLDDLKEQILKADVIEVSEVINWPVESPFWETLALFLNGVQKESNTFFLIWGTRDDFVDTKAASAKTMLENIPA
jgi:hypothetical protein